MNIVLQVEGVSFSYEKKQPVLKSVTFKVAQGEYFGLIGPSGSGKTTLLKIILGLLEADQGHVRLLGASPKEKRSQVGYLPQVLGFNRNFPISVADVIATGASGRVNRQRVDAVLSELHLGELRERRISSLSGGQLQRVLLGRAIINKPSLLVLDEPTAHVDPNTGDSLFRLIKEKYPETAVLLVTHDVSLISSEVSMVGCLNQGLTLHRAAELTPEALKSIYGYDLHIIHHDHDDPSGGHQ